MKRIPNILLVVFVLFAAFGFIVPSVHAAVGSPAPVMQESVPDIFTILAWLQDLAKTAATLTGIVLLGTAIQNAGKRYAPDYFPNNSAPQWTLGIQTFSLVLLVYLQLSGNMNLVPVIDQQAGLIANIINMVLALGYQVYASRKVHQEVLAGLPVIGTSYSGRLAGEGLVASLDMTYEHPNFDGSQEYDESIESALRGVGRE